MRVVAVPFTELGYRRLSERLPSLEKPAALPLPGNLCSAAALRPDLAASVLSRYPGGLRRAWQRLLARPRLLAEGVICYLGDDYVAKAEASAVKVLSLVVKAKAFGRVDEDEWLRAFSAGGGRGRLLALSGAARTVVVDRYPDALELHEAGLPVEALERLYPTPLELVAMVASGRLPRDLLGEAIRRAVDYVDALVRSKTLGQAYRRLGRDPSYLELVRGAGLPVFEPAEQ